MAASVTAAIWTYACGEAGTEPTPADPPRPATVALAPNTVTFTTLGDTARLAAEVRDQDGRVMAGAHVTWLTRNSTVAEVTSTGLVKAVGNGTTMVVALTRHWELRENEMRMAATSEASDSVVIRVDAPSFTLSGTVTDRRRPSLALPGILVRLEGWKHSATITDADGRYRFTNLGATLKLTVEAEFSYVSQTVEVDMNADLTRDFAMEHNGLTPFRSTTWPWRYILGPGATSLQSVTHTGRGMRTLYDRRFGNWIPVNAFLFDAHIAEQVVEFRVHPAFDSLEAASEEVYKFAPALGRLPAAFLSNVRALAILPGVGLAGAVRSTRASCFTHRTEASEGPYATAWSRNSSCTKLPMSRWTGRTSTPSAGTPHRARTACSFPTMPKTIPTGKISPRVHSRTSQCGIGQEA